MKVVFFDSHRYEQDAFESANANREQDLTYLEPRLGSRTANLAEGYDVVCSFVNDELDCEVLTTLKDFGVRLIALRSAGFNHVDLAAAFALNLPVVRVPEYSPYAVAEHAVALVLTLNRKIHRAHARVREMNFSLDGLVGFDMHGKTVGVVGTGRIGRVAARIFGGFGCRVLGYDFEPDQHLVQQGLVEYASLDRVLRESDVITLHVPLTPSTRHMIDHDAFEKMKAGAFIINTGRGALIDTKALVRALKARKIGVRGSTSTRRKREFSFVIFQT